MNGMIRQLMDRHAGRALVLICAAHWLAFALFVLSLFWAANAHAMQTLSCGGESLVERLSSEDPARLEEVRAEAAEIANGHAIFWKIEKPGVEPSFLLGTMHSADPRVTKMPDGAKQVFAAASTVIVESTDALDRDKMNAAMLALKEKTLLLDGSTLDQFVSPGSIGLLEAAVEARQMPWKIARHMQPWLVAAMIAIPICEVEAKNTGALVLDTMLAEQAKEAGKTLVGLETIEDQFTAVSSIPREFHVNALNETLKLGSLTDSLMETTKLLYLEGNTALLLPLIRAYAPETYSGKGYADFQELLISRRNRAMAEGAAEHLEKGNTFLAVGALHLPGDKGLIALLRREGFTVTPAASAID